MPVRLVVVWEQSGVSVVAGAGHMVPVTSVVVVAVAASGAPVDVASFRASQDTLGPMHSVFSLNWGTLWCRPYSLFAT